MHEEEIVRRSIERLLVGVCEGDLVYRKSNDQHGRYSIGAVVAVHIDPVQILVDFGYPSGNLSSCDASELRIIVGR